ncbi:MAG: hypothetical protein ACO3RV_03100 [Luteolibacter sp.]
MKLILPLLTFIALFAVSCERHEFDGPNGTKQLHEHHHGDHSSEDGH